jgi:CRP-like cAMP-binding protein
VISAAFVAQIHARSEPVDVTEGGTVGVGSQMLVGIKAIGGSVTTSVLVAYSVAATLVYGFDTVQFVLLSRDVLGTGAEGYGYLLAGLGLGGILAAPLVVRLERLPSLGLVILAGMATYCLPTLLFLVVSEPVAAFVVEVIRGGGTLVVDVLAITALQRALPNDILARVFGAFDTLVLAALVVGAAVAPVVIDTWGLTASLWIAGAAFPILSLAGLPALRLMDRQARARQAALAPRRTLLESCDLFSHVSEGGLEQLAGAAEVVDVPAGTAVVTEGEPATDFYVLEDGVLVVTSRGEAGIAAQVNTLEPPDYFGEIGLIERIPRTATVTAEGDARVLRIPGQDFVDALTEYTPSTALVEGAALRLGRTHPSLQLSQQATGTTTDS